MLQIAILRKFLNPLIKIIIFGGLSYVLYKQVFKSDDVNEMLQLLQTDAAGRLPLVILVFLLMFVNWSLETIKWRLLVNRLDNIDFLRAFQGVLFGVAFSLFTPNRLGEYGGRVLVLRHNRIAAIVSSLIGSYSQIVVNMIVGGTAFLLYLIFFKHISAYLSVTIGGFLVLGVVFLLVSYFNIDVVSIIFNRYSIFRKIAPYVEVVKTYSSADLRILLFFSALRYLTYALQFQLLLKFFKTGVEFFDALVLIPSVYFLQAIMPTMAIVDVSLRGEIAFQIIGQQAHGGELKVVAASVLLWLINLIIPAIIGAVAALGFHFFNGEKK